MDELRCEYCQQVYIPGEIFGGCSCCGAPAPARGKWGMSPVERIIRSGFFIPNKVREMMGLPAFEGPEFHWDKV